MFVLDLGSTDVITDFDVSAILSTEMVEQVQMTSLNIASQLRTSSMPGLDGNLGSLTLSDIQSGNYGLEYSIEQW